MYAFRQLLSLDEDFYEQKGGTDAWVTMLHILSQLTGMEEDAVLHTPKTISHNS